MFIVSSDYCLHLSSIVPHPTVRHIAQLVERQTLDILPGSSPGSESLRRSIYWSLLTGMVCRHLGLDDFYTDLVK